MKGTPNPPSVSSAALRQFSSLSSMVGLAINRRLESLVSLTGDEGQLVLAFPSVALHVASLPPPQLVPISILDSTEE